jgi:hypothetical protein
VDRISPGFTAPIDIIIIHYGNGIIVQVLEYIIGRINGQFPTALSANNNNSSTRIGRKWWHNKNDDNSSSPFIGNNNNNNNN